MDVALVKNKNHHNNLWIEISGDMGRQGEDVLVPQEGILEEVVLN
jgi:hypothetical protein